MSSRSRTIEHLCAQAGLTIKKITRVHWQILGGRYLVNWHPTTTTAYVDGMTKGVRATAAQAVAMANDLPRTDAAQRKAMTGHKRRMLAKNPHCYYCGAKLDHNTATVDHHIPRSKGGSNNPNNLVLSCDPCNKTKGDAMPDKSLAFTVKEPAAPGLIDPRAIPVQERQP